MSHTPGPWTVAPRWKIQGRHYLVAEVDIRHDAADANARLIAAAPDMLTAVDMARAVLEVVVTRNEAERLALAMCRAAIAKAKGE